MSVTIVEVRRGRVETRMDGEREWTTAMVKGLVEGPVALGALGLDGDEQADRRHHGGPDKAVLAYARSRYGRWRTEQGLDLPFGTFGENLGVDGQDEDDVHIGDVFRITGGALVEVTQPRQPCWKLAKRWGIADLTERTGATGWTGWYLRVREPAAVAPGATMDLVDRPHPDWSVARATRVADGSSPTNQRALAALPALAEAWQRMLVARAERGAPAS